MKDFFLTVWPKTWVCIIRGSTLYVGKYGSVISTVMRISIIYKEKEWKPNNS